MNINYLLGLFIHPLHLVTDRLSIEGAYKFDGIQK